jgi:hypothetical protein
MVVLGLLGRARSGKNTTAKILGGEMKEKFGHSPEEVAFADPIKDALLLVFSHLIEEGTDPFRDDDLKEKVISGTNVTPREMMRKFGMFMRATVGDDFWINKASARIKEIEDKGHAAIVTDVRFPEEADLIARMGGGIYYVDRDKVLPPLSPSDHPSEAMVYHTLARCMSRNYNLAFIRNNTTLDDLKTLVKKNENWVELH